ncbi:MAG: TlpA family protein disulfide reductase [Candidatus Bipolaricaulia bacterium]
MKDARKDVLIGLLAVAITAGLIVGGYFLFFKVGKSVATIGRSVWIDDPAPPFTLARYGSGEEVSLEELKGRPVVLNFFSATCATCLEELPKLAEFYRAHRDELAFFAISTGNSAAIIKDFVERHKPEYPLLLDEEGRTGVAYGITGVPETVFIDPEGIVRYWIIGAASRAALDEGLSKILPKEGESPNG